jgi:glycosyltransferase involved in cell wall biosynthesis
MLIKEWLPRSLRRPLSALVARVEPWLASRLDAVVLADEGTGERFAHTGRPVLVVHNFPWLELGAQDDQEPPQHDVLYHGTLPTYNIDPILSTAQRLRERGVRARWCLAAREFGEAEQATLDERLTAAGVRNEFTLHFNLPFPEIPGLVRSARIGFIALPDEEKFRRNLPRKLFEFMSLGRPVVVSDLPPIRRLVGDAGCCLLVPPGDIAGYADAVQRLLSDPALAEEMGRRGRELIRERLNAEREISPYLALCRRLTDSADG